MLPGSCLRAAGCSCGGWKSRLRHACSPCTPVCGHETLSPHGADPGLGLTQGWGSSFLLVPNPAVVPCDSHYQGFCSAALHSDSSRLRHGQDGHELLLLVGLPDPAEELVGTKTGETVTCLASLQKAPVQPSNPPFSSVAQELPRPGTPRRCPRLAPSLPRAAEMFPPPGAEPPLGRMLSTAFPPKPAGGELSLCRQSKGLLFQWCLRAQPPRAAESSVPARQTHHLGHAAAQASPGAELSQGKGHPVAAGFHVHCLKSFIRICNSSAHSNSR